MELEGEVSGVRVSLWAQGGGEEEAFAESVFPVFAEAAGILAQRADLRTLAVEVNPLVIYVVPVPSGGQREPEVVSFGRPEWDAAGGLGPREVAEAVRLLAFGGAGKWDVLELLLGQLGGREVEVAEEKGRPRVEGLTERGRFRATNVLNDWWEVAVRADGWRAWSVETQFTVRGGSLLARPNIVGAMLRRHAVIAEALDLLGGRIPRGRTFCVENLMGGAFLCAMRGPAPRKAEIAVTTPEGTAEEIERGLALLRA